MIMLYTIIYSLFLWHGSHSKVTSVCFDPGPIEFGSKLPVVPERFPHKSLTVLHFKCNNGYGLQGKSKMICTTSGKWKPTRKPSCMLRTCPLPLISNGQASVIAAEYYPGSHVTLVCNNGFILRNKHNSLIECNANGTWASASSIFPSELPECVEKLCWSPELPKNGTINVHGRKSENGQFWPGSYVTYQCFPGFKLTSYEYSHRICRNGEWAGQSPICDIISCYKPQEILNGAYISIKTPSVSVDMLYAPSYPVGTVVTYMCDPGYTLVGTDRIKCRISGSWSPLLPPVCQRSSDNGEPLCRLPMPISHGDYTVFGRSERNGALTGTIIQYSCDVGYKLLGCIQGRRECKVGVWVGPQPQCVPYIGCDKPPVIMYGGLVGWNKKSPSVYPVGSRVYYMCYNGYHLSGEPQILCRSNGCWSSRIPPSCDIPFDRRTISRPPAAGVRDLYDVKTISLATAGSVIGILVIILVLITLRRRLLPIGSRRIVLSSALQSNADQNNQSQAPHSHQIQDPDRLALIAFADNVQVVLPTYEEAIREHPLGLPNIGSPSCLSSRSGTDRASFRLSRGRLPPAPPYRGVRVPPPVLGDYQTLASARYLPGGRNCAVRSSSVSASTGESMGSTDTMTPSEVSTTVTVETLSSNASSGASSQATGASSRALCGSLTSFDTVSTANMEGAPLLEEKEECDQLDIYPSETQKCNDD